MQSINIHVGVYIYLLTTCTLMFRRVCTIEPPFFNTTSGMHRRPIEGRHLVKKILNFSKLGIWLMVGRMNVFGCCEKSIRGRGESVRAALANAFHYGPIEGSIERGEGQERGSKRGHAMERVVAFSVFTNISEF